MVTPRKPRKSTGKTTSKRAVAKKATARKGKKINKQKINQDRLQEDIRYYESQEPINVLRRTKGTKENPNGVTLASLQYDDYRHRWYSLSDRDIRITDQEYNRLAANPLAVPIYTPLHKNGKIVAFRNTRNGDLVTPYYRYRIFGKYFNPTIKDNEYYTDEQLERLGAYEASLASQRIGRLARSNDLVGSYQILHPDMNRQQIRSDPTFQNLVGQLEAFHSGKYNITPENKEIIDRIYGYDVDTTKEGMIKVMELLGRRLPGETQDPGDSDPNHIKNVVRPYYDAMRSAVPIELEEE